MSMMAARGVREVRACGRKRALRVRLALGLLLLWFAVPARAFGTGEMIDIVIQAVEPQLAPAKPLILCLISGQSLDHCVQQEQQVQASSVQLEASSQAAAALPFDPKDNRIQQIVVIVTAAGEGQWLKVLDTGGPTVAKIVVCAALPPGVKTVGCPIVEYVVDHNKQLLEKTWTAVQGPDWWELVGLLGPQTACNFIPVPEIQSTLCGPLGAAVQALAEFASDGAAAVGQVFGDAAELLVNFTEDLSGQDPPMAPEQFYATYWYPRLHWYLLSAVSLGGSPGEWSSQYEHCVGYFDSHKASKSTAGKWCAKMRSRVQAHFDATLPAIKAAPAAYLAATLRPQLPRLLIHHFDPQPGEAVKLAEKNWPYLAPYDQLYSSCVQQMRDRIAVPGVLPKHEVNLGKWNSQPDDAWKWICDQAMRAIAQELNGWRQQAGPQLLARMSGFGCQRKVSGSNSKLYLECDAFEGYDNCRREIAAHGVPGHEQCQAGHAAGAKLAAQVVAELGTKRCAQVPGYAHIRCTRPWKVAHCLKRAMPPDDAPVWHGTRLTCELQEDPAFISGQAQVKNLLFTLNGGVGSKTEAIGTKPGQGGAWKAATENDCRALWDALSIHCSSAELPAAHQISLTPCPLADPNRDGADEPCLVQVLRAPDHQNYTVSGQVVQGAVKATPQPGQPPVRTREAAPQRAERRSAQAGGRLDAAVLAAAAGRASTAASNFEAEGLLAAGKVRVSGGQAVAQPMAGFGPGWSGNAQLFWHGGAEGARLELWVDVPQDGAFAVSIALTQAPDYGQLGFEVDSHPVRTRFDGYATGVAGPVEVSLGTFAMQQGPRPVRVTLVGRNGAATGWLAGIDRIWLQPAGLP